MDDECKIIKVSDYLPEVLSRLQEDSMGLETGLGKLDNQLKGLHSAELIIIAARPSVGKTSIMTDFVLNISKTKSVLVFSLETCARTLIERMLANVAKLSYIRLKSNALYPGEEQRIKAAQDTLFKREIFIDESSLITPIDIHNRIIELTSPAKGHEVDCIFIDYLQLMALHKIGENRNQELAVICRHLKAMAKKFKIPIVVLSQLNRAVEYRDSNKPRLSDLRDSGAIEQAADVVLLLHRPSYYSLVNNPNATDTGQAEIIVAKNRNGKVGIVPCIWDGALMSFSEGVELGDF
jgi:replicative DNA helicase